MLDQSTRTPRAFKELRNTQDLITYLNANSNCDGISRKTEEELLRCGNETNKTITNASHISDLTGYIKDMAWSYEKEIGVKIQFDNYRGFERVAIPMPDYVIDSMIVTPSPLFDGDLTRRLEIEIERQIKTDKSKFDGKLSIRSGCDTCSIRKTASEDDRYA